MQKNEGPPGLRGQMIMTHATNGSHGFRGNGKGSVRMNTQAGFRMDF